jgi:hypothetical protein
VICNLLVFKSFNLFNKMKIASRKISSFQHLELLANQVVEGFISGMHRVRFTDFRLNLLSTKSIM